MPNYVQNILNIEGDKKEVDKVLKAVSNAYRTFQEHAHREGFSIIRNLWENISLKSGTAKR